MTRQTLRYGLTTALRPFDIPAWSGGCELHLGDELVPGGESLVSTSAMLAAVHARESGTERTLTIHPGARGTVKIRRLSEGPSAMHTTIHVSADCDISIEDEYRGGSVAHSTVLAIAPGSVVRYTIVNDLETDAVALVHYEARLEVAQLTWNLCSLGGATTQLSIETTVGEEGEAKTNTVVIANAKQQVDLHLSTRHTGERSSGDMLSRAVLEDDARVITHGLIRIDENAADSDSYQKSETIMLSDRASADAIPNLEIHNHRVRCSHGATIGKLDAEKLFYLTSRGVTEADAKRLVTEGFVRSLLTDELAARALAKLERT